MRLLEFYLKGGIANIVKNAMLGHAFTCNCPLCVCVVRTTQTGLPASAHTLLKENARKTDFFGFRIKELNQFADINFSDIHGHAYKRAFEFHVLAYLAEFINEYVRIFVKCPNVSQPLP